MWYSVIVCLLCDYFPRAWSGNVSSAIKSMQWCPESHHNGIYMDTYTFDTCYFSVALLFKLCSAAQELVVQNNVCARDPPMYGNRTQSMHETVVQSLIWVVSWTIKANLIPRLSVACTGFINLCWILKGFYSQSLIDTARDAYMVYPCSNARPLVVMHLSMVCPISNTWGSMGDRRGIDMS